MRALPFLAACACLAAAAASADSPPAWVGTPENLPAFPKPDPEKEFGAIKLPQPDGSVYRRPLEDWEGARRRVAADPLWRQWAGGKRAEIDAWIASVHDRPEWQAGWNHDFVDPGDGSFLVWTPEVPGEQAKSFRNKRGGEVAITPKLFNAWVGTLRKRNVEMAAEAARFYRLTGEARYAEWAAAQLDFYADHYGSWPETVSTHKNPSRLGCQSLDDAVLLSRMVETARLLFDWAGEERRRKWFDLLFKPEAELLDRSFQFVHNIAVWQRCAQAEVALLYGDEAIWKRDVDGPFGVREQLARGVTSDYMWWEQSLGYNTFVVQAALPMLTTAALLGRGDSLRAEAAIVENLMISPLTLAFPDGTLPNPADSTDILHASAGQLAEASRILPTAPGVRRTLADRSWGALIDPPDPVPASMPDMPPVASRNLESTRFALLRKGPWQVFFHYGQLNLSHSQAEALNFSASFEGLDVTHDPGTVGYGSPMAAGFYRQALAANVPLFDGEGQKPWSSGKLLAFDAAAGAVSAEQPDYRPGVSARRSLRIEGDALIDEASIASASEKGRPGLCLNLQGEPRPGPAFAPAADFAKGRPAAFGYWQGVQAATFHDRAEIEVAYPGGRVLKVEFSVPGPFTVYAASAPDRPPRRRAGFYVEAAPAQEATFVTRISPVR